MHLTCQPTLPKLQFLKVNHHLLSNAMELGLWIPIKGFIPHPSQDWTLWKLEEQPTI